MISDFLLLFHSVLLYRPAPSRRSHPHPPMHHVPTVRFRLPPVRPRARAGGNRNSDCRFMNLGHSHCRVISRGCFWPERRGFEERRIHRSFALRLRRVTSLSEQNAHIAIYNDSHLIKPVQRLTRMCRTKAKIPNSPSAIGIRSTFNANA